MGWMARHQRRKSRRRLSGSDAPFASAAKDTFGSFATQVAADRQDCVTWLKAGRIDATESRLKSVAHALLRAASRLSRRFFPPRHMCPQECGHGTLRAHATLHRTFGRQ